MMVCIIKRFFFYVYWQIPVQPFVFNAQHEAKLQRKATTDPKMVKRKIKNT